MSTVINITMAYTKHELKPIKIIQDTESKFHAIPMFILQLNATITLLNW